jgi:hypothetical protein
MTNTNPYLRVAKRLEALGHAVHEHNEAAGPNALCGDPQFWRDTASLLEHHPDEPLAFLIMDALLREGE